MQNHLSFAPKAKHPRGRPTPNDIRAGVFVTFEAPDEFIQRSLAEYNTRVDDTGRYAAICRPYHLAGMEISVSVLRAGLLGEPTGSPIGLYGDVVAIAKRDLAAGEVLDGEGGYCVYGKLRQGHQPVEAGELPVGLATGVRPKWAVPADTPLRWADVQYDGNDYLVRLRRQMEARFVGEWHIGARPSPISRSCEMARRAAS